MEIKNITDFKSNKKKIEAEGVTFALYKSDIAKYDIKLGEMPEKVYFTDTFASDGRVRTMEKVVGCQLTTASTPS